MLAAKNYLVCHHPRVSTSTPDLNYIFMHHEHLPVSKPKTKNRFVALVTIKANPQNISFLALTFVSANVPLVRIEDVSYRSFFRSTVSQ